MNFDSCIFSLDEDCLVCKRESVSVIIPSSGAFMQSRWFLRVIVNLLLGLNAVENHSAGNRLRRKDAFRPSAVFLSARRLSVVFQHHETCWMARVSAQDQV